VRAATTLRGVCNDAVWSKLHFSISVNSGIPRARFSELLMLVSRRSHQKCRNYSQFSTRNM